MIKKHAEHILSAITNDRTVMGIAGNKHPEYFRALTWLKQVYTGGIILVEVPKPSEQMVTKAPIGKKTGKLKGTGKTKK